jgi:hypothetical protein
MTLGSDKSMESVLSGIPSVSKICKLLALANLEPALRYSMGLGLRF